MPIFSIFAIYFIIWWLTLFIVLPIGLRTQAEENEVVPGTVESAPARFRALRVFLLTTVLAAIIHLRGISSPCASATVWTQSRNSRLSSIEIDRRLLSR